MRNIERKINRIDAHAELPSRLEKKVAAILHEKNRPGFKSPAASKITIGTRNALNQKFSDENLGQRQYHHPGYLGGLENKRVGEVLDDHYKERVSANGINNSEIRTDDSTDDDNEVLRIDLV